MSQPAAESRPVATQTLLYDLQDSMLPLLGSLDIEADHVSHYSRELFRYENALGSLTVRHASELLHVHLSEPERKTEDELDIPAMQLKAEFVKHRNGMVTPSPLYTRLGFVVIMKAEDKPLSARYVPLHWPDGGTSLESDIYGSLGQADLSQLQNFTVSMVNAAVAYRQNQNPPLLTLVKP